MFQRLPAVIFVTEYPCEIIKFMSSRINKGGGQSVTTLIFRVKIVKITKFSTLEPNKSKYCQLTESNQEPAKESRPTIRNRKSAKCQLAKPQLVSLKGRYVKHLYRHVNSPVLKPPKLNFILIALARAATRKLMHHHTSQPSIN